jgi:hypothetical protein
MRGRACAAEAEVSYTLSWGMVLLFRNSPYSTGVGAAARHACDGSAAGGEGDGGGLAHAGGAPAAERHHTPTRRSEKVTLYTEVLK